MKLKNALILNNIHIFLLCVLIFFFLVPYQIIRNNYESNCIVRLLYENKSPVEKLVANGLNIVVNNVYSKAIFAIPCSERFPVKPEIIARQIILKIEKSYTDIFTIILKKEIEEKYGIIIIYKVTLFLNIFLSYTNQTLHMLEKNMIHVI